MSPGLDEFHSPCTGRKRGAGAADALMAGLHG